MKGDETADVVMTLKRDYCNLYTRGYLFVNGNFLCYTLERSWDDNKKGRSCIPEGIYELSERRSAKFGRHLLVNGVEGRSLILIHSANDALLELKGCIAPVTRLLDGGRGFASKKALAKIMAVFDEAQKHDKKVWLKTTGFEHNDSLQDVTTVENAAMIQREYISPNTFLKYYDSVGGKVLGLTATVFGEHEKWFMVKNLSLKK